MRLWHKYLISVLPNQQLVAQWRELLAIKGAIEKNGTPNHRLVNKILDYSVREFIFYSITVHNEMKVRGMKPNKKKAEELFNFKHDSFADLQEDPRGLDDLYIFWHEKRYLTQCFYNLQEKFDCGIISAGEFMEIQTRFKMVTTSYDFKKRLF